MKAAMKFRVRSEGHSAEIQRALFAMGYRWDWGMGGSVVQETEHPFLYANKDGSICYSTVGSDLFFAKESGTLSDVVGGSIWPLAEFTAGSPEVKQLDLRPRHIAEQQRMAEIVEAIQRYVAEYKHIPDEWLRELTDLNINILTTEKN